MFNGRFNGYGGACGTIEKQAARCEQLVCRINKGIYKMITERINEIEDAINKLTVDLLVPIRGSKTINQEAFDKLHFLLDELIINLKDEKTIKRSLAGLIFFIYTTVVAESEHLHYSDPIFIEAGRLEEYLDRLLDYSSEYYMKTE